MRCVPWSPAAWTTDAISADDNRSGRETSAEPLSVKSQQLDGACPAYNLRGRHRAQDSSLPYMSGRSDDVLSSMGVGIRFSCLVDQDVTEQGRGYQHDL